MLFAKDACPCIWEDTVVGFTEGSVHERAGMRRKSQHVAYTKTTAYLADLCLILEVDGRVEVGDLFQNALNQHFALA